MNTVKVFFHIIKYAYKARFEYPGALVGGIVAQWFSYGIYALMVVLTVRNFGSLAGWEPPQILFMFAIWLLTYSVGASFTFNFCMDFRNLSIKGTLDEAYIRPFPPFLYLIATTFNAGYISHVTLSGAALWYSMSQMDISWGLGEWLWFVVILISGGVITACMMLICDMPAIRTRSDSPTSMFFWQMREFAQYPITIYPRFMQIIFTTILPFGFVGFYPVQVLLGKQDGLLPHINMWLAPVVAALCVGATVLCWRALTRGYESAGT